MGILHVNLKILISVGLISVCVLFYGRKKWYANHFCNQDMGFPIIYKFVLCLPYFVIPKG